jgi:hypothetical protein
MEEKKNKGGRPRKFKTVQDLETCIENYKSYLEENKKPPTIAGLAYYTGVDRQTLYNYKEKDEYFDTIKGFVNWVLMEYEERALTDSTAGLIFLLKNYGYADKQEIDHTTGGKELNQEIKVTFHDYKE